MKNRDDLVHQAGIFIELKRVEYWVIFYLAESYADKAGKDGKVEIEKAFEALKHWQKTGKYNSDVEDLCLDLLSQRLLLHVIKEKIKRVTNG